MTPELHVGDVIADNDPRMKHRGELILDRITSGPGGTLYAVCRNLRGRGTIRIRLDRIHADDRPRRSGYRVVRPATPPPETLPDA